MEFIAFFLLGGTLEQVPLLRVLVSSGQCGEIKRDCVGVESASSTQGT